MPLSPNRLVWLALAGTLAVASCAGTPEDANEDGAVAGYGQPADASEIDRIVEVVASDDLRFSPDAVTVAPGETITFRVVNEGKLVHDFTLGDEAAQAAHEEEMAEMPDMAHDEDNAVEVPAGETEELTWRFDEGGEVIYGCHQSGHYAAGMKGRITVTS